MQCWKLNLSQRQSPQTNVDTCFIGGKPRLLLDLPLHNCELCGAQQSFYFQAALPAPHPWAGFTLAVFACTSCIDRDQLIPDFPSLIYKDRNIPEGFLTAYQTNFRLLVFETRQAQVRTDYQERVKFRRWDVIPTSNPRSPSNKIGGEPNWEYEDEAPATYNQMTPMVFLMQIKAYFHFDLLNDAPRQMDIDWFGGERIIPSKHSYYDLFIGNANYFFGTNASGERLIYVVVQKH